MTGLDYPRGTTLLMCPTEMAMDMAVNTKGANCENVKVIFLEPVNTKWSKVINANGRTEVVWNGHLSFWS